MFLLTWSFSARVWVTKSVMFNLLIYEHLAIEVLVEALFHAERLFIVEVFSHDTHFTFVKANSSKLELGIYSSLIRLIPDIILFVVSTDLLESSWEEVLLHTHFV